MPYPSNDPPDAIEANYRVTAGELRAFVERIEYCDAQMQEIRDDKKEIFAEAKARGYDVKVIRRVVAERKREPDDIAEEQAVFDMYWEALTGV